MYIYTYSVYNTKIKQKHVAKLTAYKETTNK